MSNDVEPDQTAPLVWSGSALYAYAILLGTLVYEILGHLWYIIWNQTLEQGLLSQGYQNVQFCRTVHITFWMTPLVIKTLKFWTCNYTISNTC